MKPKETIDIGQQDLFRSRLDQIIDMKNGMVIVAGLMDWDRLAEACGGACSDKPGRPALPTRLMAGLHILKYACNFSDEGVAAMWLMCPYFQYFCGEEFFRHDLPLDRSSMTRWRQRMGEKKVAALLQESLHVALRTGAMKRSDFSGVVVDTTVQPKNIAFPTDARLLHKAREFLVNRARATGVKLRRSCSVLGRKAFECCSRSKPGRTPENAVNLLRTYLDNVAKEVGRRIAGDPDLLNAFKRPLRIAERVRTQRPRDGKGRHVHAVHEPGVECIGKGKRHRLWEFGVKVSTATTINKCAGGQFILHAAALFGNPCDGHTLEGILPAIERLTGVSLQRIFLDRGYRGNNAPPEHQSKIIATGQGSLTTYMKKRLKRRNAVEPVIGHAKKEHRMDRNYLSGPEGDAVNAVLAAAGYNFHLLFRWAEVVFCHFLERLILIRHHKLA